MEIVSARDLEFSIHGNLILKPMSFSIEEGLFAAFIGPSGCGKTTLLNIIAGLYKSYRGSLTVMTSRISFVFQHDSLLEWKSALDNVLLPFTLAGVPIDEKLVNKAGELLELVGLGGYQRYFPQQLSGGMKKRVEIARALVTDPQLLILDEPFSSLDILTRERLNLLVRDLHGLRRTTIVLVTHSVEEACFLSQRIYVLSPFPAEIVAVKQLAAQATQGGEEGSMFVLSGPRQSLNEQIRREAKLLWDGTLQEKTASLARHPRAGGAGALETVRRFGRKHWANLLVPFELLLIYFALGWLKTALAIPDIIFPHPAAIGERFFRTLGEGAILRDIHVTVIESLSGFSIAFAVSMIFGFLIARFKTASRVLMPYFIGANTIPSVALAPFLVLWFGFGMTPRVVTSVIVIFFPLLINVTAAFKHAEERVHCLKTFYRPGLLRSLFGMEFPAALPGIFSGIKISITLSVIGAVVGQFVSGHEGLGSLVSRAKALFDIELMFVGLLWLVLLGLAYYGLASFLYFLIQKSLHQPSPGGPAH